MNKTIKAILIEFLIYSVLFILSLCFFPICNFYYLGENDSMLTKPQYFFDFEIAYSFIVYFLIIITGFFSLKKWLIISINILVMIFMFLTFLFVKMLFGWWGASPFHPDFQLGYWLSQSLILVLIIRTFTLLDKISEINLNKKITLFFSFFSISIPVCLFGFVYLGFYGGKSEPIQRFELESQERGRIIKHESWDYLEDYNAMLSKYFSTDTLRKEKYKLDSVSFTFYDDNSKIIKKFSKTVSNGSLDIEEILNENAD
jgi:hypothetical protein